VLAKRPLLLLGCLLAVSACLWRSYEEIMRVHLEVLSGMARKAEARAETDRRPAPNDVTELLYPLERARQFLRQNQKRAGRPSYRAFEELLARYADFVAEVDSARVDEERWREFRARVAGDVRALEDRAAAVRAALQKEG
jgi:hypothetical protein